MKLIDLETGVITLSNGVTLQEGTTLEYVRTNLVNNLGQNWKGGVGYLHQGVKDIFFDGYYLVFTLSFLEEKLQKIRITPSEKPLEPRLPGQEEIESQQHQLNQTWFPKYIGEQGYYSWGFAGFGFGTGSQAGPAAWIAIDYTEKSKP